MCAVAEPRENVEADGGNVLVILYAFSMWAWGAASILNGIV